MPVAATEKVWTLDELHALPDDGNKYEVVRGALFVTPAPSYGHETIASRLSEKLTPYVYAHRLGRVFHPRAVVRFAGSEAEPDLMVRPEIPGGAEWETAAPPLLVVEVTSPSTRRTDYTEKRQYYLDAGVAEYWIVDQDTRAVTVVRPGGPDAVVLDQLIWEPADASEPLDVSVAWLFSG